MLIEWIIMTALATAYVAGAVSSSHLLDPARIWLAHSGSKLAMTLAKGMSCSFCMSFWSSMIMVAMSPLQFDAINILGVASASALIIKVMIPKRQG